MLAMQAFPFLKAFPCLFLKAFTCLLSCLLSRPFFLSSLVLKISCLAEKGMVRTMNAFLLVSSGAIVQGASVRTVAKRTCNRSKGGR
jgi:hypothetical protein